MSEKIMKVDWEDVQEDYKNKDARIAELEIKVAEITKLYKASLFNFGDSNGVTAYLKREPIQSSAIIAAIDHINGMYMGLIQGAKILNIPITHQVK